MGISSMGYTEELLRKNAHSNTNKNVFLKGVMAEKYLRGKQYTTHPLIPSLEREGKTNGRVS
jgi:hypothetical protein